MIVHHPNDLISVIMPVYNTAAFLEESIGSVLRQTYRNWELILVDDGSDDGSGRICDAYAREDDRIRYIHLSNSGVSRARNTGLREAHGEWVCFMDSDDWLEDGALETLIRHSSGADLVMGFYPINTGTPFRRAASVCVLYPQSDPYYVAALGYYSVVDTVWDKLYRRESITGMFDEQMRRWEDTCFNLSQVCKWQKVVLLPDKLYNYRMDGRMSLSVRISMDHLVQAHKHYELYNSVFDSFPELMKHRSHWYIREVWMFFQAIWQCKAPLADRQLLIRLWVGEEVIDRTQTASELLNETLTSFWRCIMDRDADAVCALCETVCSAANKED